MRRGLEGPNPLRISWDGHRINMRGSTGTPLVLRGAIIRPCSMDKWTSGGTTGLLARRHSRFVLVSWRLGASN